MLSTLTKARIIEAIQQLNKSARREWLELFATPALCRYLDHLQVTLEPRDRTSTWTRPQENRAVVTRTPCW